ncbi:hypothetical protein ScPMuIL_011709, partial [Solemya velum]
KLTSPPILAYADFQKPFIVTTDASTEGLGAVLYQVQDGQERVIAYASRGLRPSEKNYPAHKLEFLCLKWAVSDKFHDYLYGNTFEARTDNNSLTYVMKSAKLDATSHRWLASLSNYNFKLIYRSGRCNQDADGLSRRPQQMQEMFPEVVKALSHAALVQKEELLLAEGVLLSDSSVLSQPEPEVSSQDFHSIDWSKEQLSDTTISRVVSYLKSGRRPSSTDLQQETSEVRKLIREWKNFKFFNDILYRLTALDGQTVQQVVLPVCFKDTVMKSLHDDSGHQGRDRTRWLVKQRFFWTGLDSDVDRYVKNCANCIRRKSPIGISAELVPIQTSQPMELVCIDFLGLERSKGGYENILVITDHFTRYAQAIPTRNQKAKITAQALYDFFCHYGFPAKLHSDQGRNFESQVIKELCHIAGVKKTRTTPYHPQSNGMTERFNQSLISMLGTLENHQKADWRSYVAPLVHAYNATRHDTTGYSPHYLMFGWHPRLAVDAFLGIPSPEKQTSSREGYVKKLKKRLDFAYKVARSHAEKQTARYKKNYDRKVRESILEVGDRVLVRNVGLKGKQKLADKWAKDPHVVIAIPIDDIPVYEVQKELGNGPVRTVHRNMLLPFTCQSRRSSRTRQSVSPSSSSLDRSLRSSTIPSRLSDASSSRSSTPSSTFTVGQEHQEPLLRRSHRQRRSPNRYGEW